MSNKNPIHIVPHGDGWATRRENSSRAGVVTSTQREAIERARVTADREGSQIKVHRPNGQFRKE